jgi:hypothetical protein
MMPNYVINELLIKADEATTDKLLETIKDDKLGKGSIDFNKLIPMPEELDIEDGSRSYRGLEIYAAMQKKAIVNHDDGHYEILDSDKETYFAEVLQKYADNIKNDPDIIACGKTYFENIKRHGVPTWYGWRIENWDNKWNAINVGSGDHSLSFKTAWNAVPKIIAKISEMFPSARLTYKYADEEIGYGLGMTEYADGELVDEYPFDEESIEALEFAEGLWGIGCHDSDSFANVYETEREAAPATYVRAERPAETAGMDDGGDMER